MADVICLDSDSDFESSPPKNARAANSRSRRKTRRGRQGKARQTSSSIDNNTSPHHIEGDTPGSNTCIDPVPSTAVSTENAPCPLSRDTSVDSLSVISSVSSDQGSKDVIGDKSLPVCQDKGSKVQNVSNQSRKTARRGLARKTTSCSESTAVTSAEAPTELTIHRKASVYSDERVSHALQNIYNTGCQLTESHDTLKESEELTHAKDKRVKARQQQQEEGHAVSSGDESIELVGEGGNDPSFVRSPTPPPEVTMNKPQRISRRAQKALRTLNTVKARIDVAGRKFQSPVIIPVDSPMVKADMVIKVRFLSKVYRLRHNLSQPFHQLLTKVSQEIGKKEDHLGLFLNDCSLDLTSTPKDVDLSVADIIECYNMTEAGGHFKGDSINVVIQCSNSKKKTTMTAYKRLPMQDLMDRYASKFDLDISTFTFCFDGEYVSPMDTLLKLDAEEGDVLDVVPKDDRNASLAYAHRTQMITLM